MAVLLRYPVTKEVTSLRRNFDFMQKSQIKLEQTKIFLKKEQSLFLV